METVESINDVYRVERRHNEVTCDGFVPAWKRYYGVDVRRREPLRCMQFMTFMKDGVEVETYVTFTEDERERVLTAIVGYIWPTS